VNRGLTVFSAIAVAFAALVVVGRWQASHEIDGERRGMQRIFEVAAARRIPDAWRITTTFRCLLYRGGSNAFAYELCFDTSGRLVEALDRTGRDLVVYTLRSEPSKASIRVDSAALDAVLREMKAYGPGAPREAAIRPQLYFRPPPKPPHMPKGSGLPGVRGGSPG
jgi:hypothetical protein